MHATQQSQPVSLQVVYALARATDTDPLDLHPPLHSVIDSVALDRLFQADTVGCLRFRYEGHQVEVRGDGAILVDGTRYDV